MLLVYCEKLNKCVDWEQNKMRLKNNLENLLYVVVTLYNVMFNSLASESLKYKYQISTTPQKTTWCDTKKTETIMKTNIIAEFYRSKTDTMAILKIKRNREFTDFRYIRKT